ncbi:hypothetical protein UPYG_G00011600 [Umbra pygmaea]|uniref:Uncharacterized protein n=1 Tax=Umbra pygmaea TaxID=75934 RepID=A0ABD0XIP1_UMBPY
MWNVPPTRRFSHDETDMWTSGQIPSYLHRWGTAEDVMGTAHYNSSLPRHERRRNSLVSYHEESHLHRKRRRSEDSGYMLKQLPRGSGGERFEEADLRCFSRDEVINFIDETPLPSPMKSPRHTSTVSLIPDVHEQHIILYPHFPLTDFEREPQALRRLSEHGRSCTWEESPEGSHRAERVSGGENTGVCRSGKGSLREHWWEQEGNRLLPVGQSLRTGEHSFHRPSRTGAHGASWGERRHQPTEESKGSTNSFVSSPSASSSGYITFHSDSIGSAT